MSFNSRAELSLLGSTEYHPGHLLRARVELTKSNDWNSISLRLIGTSRAILMGEDRLQAGVMANMGSGGSAQLITSNMSLEFINAEATLVSPHDAVEDGSKDDKKSSKARDKGKGEDVRGGIFEIIIPKMEESLPTFTEMSESDPARVSITYQLVLIGKRSGIFKINDKLIHDICVTIPQPRLITSHELEERNWPTHSIERSLKFQTSNGDPLTVDATIAVRPVLSPSEDIFFTLTLSPKSADCSQLFTEVPTVDASIARAIRTSPIANSSASSGMKIMDWARIRISHVRGIKIIENKGGVTCDLRWSGKIAIPKNQLTLESQLIGVKYFVGCQITSKAFTSPMIIQISVHLPSTADVTPSNSVRMEHNISEPHDQLPQYIA